MQRVIVSEADIVSRCRSVAKPGSYMILPQANRVPSTIPGFQRAVAQALATPQLGARFVQYELLLQTSGGTAKPLRDDLEHFWYVLEGEVQLGVNGTRHALDTGGFAWLPPGTLYDLANAAGSASRVLWLRRRYEQVEGLAVPAPLVTHEKDIPALPEDTYLEQHLIPYENPSFDMGVNLLNFEPGVYFGFVESHVMEHGLYMLAGRGIYWLNGDYHEVQANDFIYMAPYCPQFFYATGWETGRYLVYKDVNRDYVHSL
ncbi:MAG: cupin domain-containing protein [Chloroflexi bacterium]|nr:cupin domain-containing protein [Chloroflexota bacterium]